MEWTEELGFDQVWLTEHHFIDYGLSVDPATWPPPPPRARGVSDRARRRHPALSSPAAAGRADRARRHHLQGAGSTSGVGRGNRPAEFTGYHVPQQENRERFDEAVDIMLKAWTEERFSHAGRFFTVDEARVIPKPLQRPHPPIYQVCGSNDGIESTAAPRLADAELDPHRPVEQLLTRRDTYVATLRRHGRSEAEIAALIADWGVSRQIYVAPTDAQALAEAKDAEMWYQESLRRFQVPERIEDAHPSLQPGFRAGRALRQGDVGGLVPRRSPSARRTRSPPHRGHARRWASVRCSAG